MYKRQQLTWENNKAYVYDAATGRQLRTFAYAGEGWGLTTDGERDVYKRQVDINLDVLFRVGRLQEQQLCLDDIGRIVVNRSPQKDDAIDVYKRQGKDSSKVDRSAAYAARYIAKNMATLIGELPKSNFIRLNRRMLTDRLKDCLLYTSRCV